MVEITVRGRSEQFSGQTVDLSGTGALIWITDERFAREDDRAQLIRYGERVAAEFGDSMRIRFDGSSIMREAEVVRVSRNQQKNGPLLIAIRFLSPLHARDCKRLGLDAAAVMTDDQARRKISPIPTVKPPPAKAARAEPQSERRRAPRIDRIFYAQVAADGRPFKAQVLNLSYSGALITFTDAAFMPPPESEKLVLFTRRIGTQFGAGMLLRILEGEVSVQADLIHVSERRESDELLVVVGCKFRRALTREECDRLELEPPPGHGPRKTAVNPYRGKTNILDLMRQSVQAGATDLHIKVGGPPRLRMSGTLLAWGQTPLTQDVTHTMALELMSEEQAARFEREGDVELAHTIDDAGRFRVNILRQRGLTGMAIRCIPDKIPSIEDLGLHPLCRELAERPRGLVLVTGPTGSGKSTTLAALIGHINRTRACHIITMEDPIEYLHTDVEAHITQREIGRDAVDFATALKRALRQDPDVIMVGEMRDLETVALALTAAETGHLVFATLHTTSAFLSPGRIVDVFPPGQQTQIRLQLADSLQGVLAQQLLPRENGEQGVVLAQEVLIATDGVRALIRESKSPQIANMMQTGVKEGMQTLESALNDLVERGLIRYETALAKANFPKQIRRNGDRK